MSFERVPSPGAEPVPPGLGEASGPPGNHESTPALQLQVLATEHWGLLATRSLAWSESFTRGGMFLSALSGAIVALALVAQVTEFGNEFTLFALVILPVVLLIGLTSYVRMGAVNYYDTLCVVGMNRIRNAYLRLTPEVEPYLVFGSHDDFANITLTMGVPPGSNFVVSAFVAIPFVVNIINSLVAGVILTLLARLAGVPLGIGVGIGAIGGLALLTSSLMYARRNRAMARTILSPRFPSEGD